MLHDEYDDNVSSHRLQCVWNMMYMWMIVGYSWGDVAVMFDEELMILICCAGLISITLIEYIISNSRSGCDWMWWYISYDIDIDIRSLWCVRPYVCVRAGGDGVQCHSVTCNVIHSLSMSVVCSTSWDQSDNHTFGIAVAHALYYCY